MPNSQRDVPLVAVRNANRLSLRGANALKRVRDISFRLSEIVAIAASTGIWVLSGVPSLSENCLLEKQKFQQSTNVRLADLKAIL